MTQRKESARVLQRDHVGGEVRVAHLGTTRQSLEGAAIQSFGHERLDGFEASEGVVLIVGGDLNDEAEVGHEAGLSGSGHSRTVPPAVSNSKAGSLPRYPTQSPDHFTCRCGYWCLNSPCPRCEKPEEK